MVISHFRRPPPLCKMPPKDDIVALAREDVKKSAQNTDTPK